MFSYVLKLLGCEMTTVCDVYLFVSLLICLFETVCTKRTFFRVIYYVPNINFWMEIFLAFLMNAKRDHQNKLLPSFQRLIITLRSIYYTSPYYGMVSLLVSSRKNLSFVLNMPLNSFNFWVSRFNK